MRARTRAHRWDVTGLAAVALLVAGVLGRSSQVSLPFAELPIPTGLLTTLGTVMLVTIPLMSAVPELERSLLREARVRLARVAVALGTAVCVFLGVSTAMTGGLGVGPGPNLRFFLALAVVAVLSVVVTGEIAWLVPSTLGFLGLIVDAGINQPLSSALARPPLAAYWLLIVGAAAVYVRRGPRLPA